MVELTVPWLSEKWGNLSMPDRCCPKDDRYNCKYCNLAGTTCDGPPGYRRCCIDESYTERVVEHKTTYHFIKNWVYTYSDGTTEQLTMTEKFKK